MATAIIEPERIHPRNEVGRGRGRYVLYWMQASVRSQHNHALEYAIQEANEAGVRLLVVFVLVDAYPDASVRSYTFLLEGVEDAAAELKRRGVKFVVRRGDPVEVVSDLAAEACSIVIDRGYLRHQRRWRQRLAERLDRRLVEVESNLVVPVQTTSSKREYAARTIRPKIHDHLDRFAVELRPTPLDKHSLNLSVAGEDDPLTLVDRLSPPVEAAPVEAFRGGTSQARVRLRHFVAGPLRRYDRHRNQPQTDEVSYLSMYLHFGHLSPVQALLAARASGAPAAEVDVFTEELVVRRELAHNYTWFEPDYDRYRSLPDWARSTLANHRDDDRPARYTRRELIDAATHDRYWNAAMVEMRHTGYLHNYMRMYWGKKILEWTNTPEYGFRTALDLNNAYLLDGRDSNSYANVAWVFGLHDRPWQERPVFGTVRYMSASGLERKADPEGYVRKVEERTGVDVGGS